MSAEFDKYAKDYDELLRDPIRDRFSGNETDFFHRRKWILIHRALPQLGIIPSQSAWLDVGCGKGELLSLGQSTFCRVAGCDLSREMLSAAAIEIHQQSQSTRLPFENESFNFVTAVCVYHHVELSDRQALTADVVRILRPGGVFCIIEHNPLNPATRIVVNRLPVDANAHLLRLGQAARYLRDAGLEIIYREFFLYFPAFLYDHFAFLESALSRVPLGGQYAVFGRKPGDHSIPMQFESALS
jgi:SAM-dependent methyltransferase